MTEKCHNLIFFQSVYHILSSIVSNRFDFEGVIIWTESLIRAGKAFTEDIINTWCMHNRCTSLSKKISFELKLRR